MPRYEYECQKCGNFEVQQKMSDKALTQCPTCGSSVTRVITPFAVSFAGSGFYKNDSRPNVEVSSSSSTPSPASSSKCSGSSCSSCKGCS